MNGDKAIFIWPESSFPVHRGVEAGSHFHPFGMAEDSDLRKTRFHSHFLFDENSHFYLTIFTTDYLKKREREIGRERERERKRKRERFGAYLIRFNSYLLLCKSTCKSKESILFFCNDYCTFVKKDYNIRLFDEYLLN